MSYFMIAVGTKPDLSSIPKIEAIPVKEAQEYVQRLIPILLDKLVSDVWFIHDGETGTSHNFIQSSIEQMQMDSMPFSKTLLSKTIGECAKAGDSFRIWWAGGELEVEKCTSVENVMYTIIKQVNGGKDIGIGYERKP